MKKITLITTFFVTISCWSFSQHEVSAQSCGTPEFTKEMLDKVQAATEQYMNGTMVKSNMPYNIPITLHNMRNTSGSIGIDITETLEIFCQTVEFYAQHDINLYIHDIKTHYNSSWTKDDPANTNKWINIIASTIDPDDDNSIHIYGFEDLPGTCGYFLPGINIIAFDCMDWANIAHQLGHHFGLPHTFQEGLSSGCNIQHSLLGERVDGSNCAWVTDRICDTPPDNNSSFRWCPDSTECQMYDPLGVAFFPDVTNIMSYYGFECVNKFTPGQCAVMHNTIEQDFTNLLVANLPNMNPVTEAVELVSPLGIEVPYDQVLFTWNAPENANWYHIEINRLSNFSPSFTIESVMIEEAQYISTQLYPNTTYFWRVKAFNKANPCIVPGTLQSGSFKTNDQTVSIQDPEDIRSFEISPNPVSGNRFLTISLNSAKPMSGHLNLYNISGQRIHSEVAQLVTSSNTLNLDVKGVPTGLYIVQFESVEATVQHKLIIH